MSQTIYIANATLITPHETIKGGEMLIAGGTILAVAQKGVIQKPKKARIIDAKGRLVVPGFIDVHVQGAGGADVLDGTKRAIKTIARALAKEGTTSFLATTVITDKRSAHLGVIDEVMKEGTGGAEVLGIHLEGPYINPLRRGMIRAENIRKASIKDLRHIMKCCKHRLAMMTVAPEVQGVATLIPELTRRGIVASFGHSDATYVQTRRGLKKGITHVTHICNAMPSLHHRAPGPLAAIAEHEQCTIQLIADGIHIHPSVVRLLIKAVGMQRIVLITDAMSATGLKDGNYTYNELTYTARQGAARYTDGTLIGTALTLRQMVARLRKHGGVSLREAIAAATLNPARTLGIEHRKGSLMAGKDADVVIMDRRLKVYNVLIGGKIVT
jgi:N-acetylglucosamine-6-phosphate deacetylase